MPPWLRDARELFQGVRLADVIDVAVVSALVYAALIWIQRARSRFVVGGFAALIALYFAARLLKMYLTLFLFQVGVTVAAVALVVIFQEDIRRAFERIATSRLLGARRTPAASADVVDVIAASAALFAERRIGALFVLRGKEPLERHTSGGVVLDGRVSEALFSSIFDPGSPGHDGAAIIDNGLVTKFGVHLPLSTQIKQGMHLGTRHAAAIGLSERSDALVVAVSEERGVISLAHAGQLEVLDSAAELKRRTLDFLREVSPEQRVAWYRRLFARNLGSKALSVAIATIAWIAVFGQQSETIATTYDVPVVYRGVGDDWLLEEPKPASARITLSGTQHVFENVDLETLNVALPLSEIRPGAQLVRIADDHVQLPRDLVVHRIDPRRVLVVAHRTVRRDVAVQPATRGSLPRGVTLIDLVPSPDRVKLLVKATQADAVESVSTEPIDLTEISTPRSISVALVIPKHARLPEGADEEIRVRVVVSEAPPR